MKGKTERIVTSMFIMWELVFYLVFLRLDMGTGESNITSVLKYITIVFCFLYTIYLAIRMKRDTAILLVGISFFTLASDTVLLFTNYFIAGILSFILVQTLHFLRIGRMKNWKLKQYVVRYGIRLLVAVFLILLLPQKTLLMAAGAVYGTNLVGNWGEAVMGAWRQKNCSFTLLSIGFFAFILCDINVALFNLTNYMVTFTSIAMWLFYLPSQVLIVLSENSR